MQYSLHLLSSCSVLVVTLTAVSLVCTWATEKSLCSDHGLRKLSKMLVRDTSEHTGTILLLDSWQNHLLRYVKSGKLISAWLSTHIPQHLLYHTQTEKEICLMTQSKAFAHTNTNTQWEAISTRLELSASHRAPSLGVSAFEKARQYSSNFDNGCPPSRAATV